MVVGEIRGGRDPCTLGGLLPLQWIYSRPRLHCAQQLTSSFQARQGSRGAPHLSRGLCTLLRPFNRRQRAGPRLAHLPGGRPVYIHRVRLQVLSSREQRVHIHILLINVLDYLLYTYYLCAKKRRTNRRPLSRKGSNFTLQHSHSHAPHT